MVAPVVYAELAADGAFADAAALDEFLSDFSVGVADPSTAPMFRAGDAFRAYVDRRPDGLQCPSCEAERTVACPDCGASLAPRQHVAADFVIGGHAVTDADALVTFDDAFYDTYFASLAARPG